MRVPGWARRLIPLNIMAMILVVHLKQCFPKGIGIITIGAGLSNFFKISENLHVTL
jgi:hypothetical protein